MLGIILAALSGGLRFGQQALVAQGRETAAANQVAPVDAALRSLVGQAWPGAAGAEARFAGTARSLSFRTVMPESLTAQRTRDAEVAIGVDPAHRLYLAWLPWYRNWIVPKPPPARIDLLANVDHIEFAYWDPSLHLAPGGWVTAWVGTTRAKAVADPAGLHERRRSALARHHCGHSARSVDDTDGAARGDDDTPNCFAVARFRSGRSCFGRWRCWRCSGPR